MSNHITAGQTKFVKLVYTNDVVTYIPLYFVNAKYVRERIEFRIAEHTEEIKTTIYGGHYQTDDYIGIVWKIDFEANYNFQAPQLLCYVPEFLVADTINIGYIYDLGENESWDDIMFTFNRPRHNEDKIVLVLNQNGNREDLHITDNGYKESKVKR